MEVDDSPREAPPTTGEEDNVSVSVRDVFGPTSLDSSSATPTQGPSENPASRDAPLESPVSATGSVPRDPRRSILRQTASSSSSFGGIDPADLSANLERLSAAVPAVQEANLRESHTALVVSLSVEERQRLLETEVGLFRAELARHLRFDLPVEQVSEPLSSRHSVVAYRIMRFERDWSAARALAYREVYDASTLR